MTNVEFCKPEIDTIRTRMAAKTSKDSHALNAATGIMTLKQTTEIWIALFLAAGLLSACDVETFDEASSAFQEDAPPPPPPPSPPPGGGSFSPTWSAIQSNVFTPTCATANCHSGGAPSGGLNLSAANSYAELVGINSAQDPGILRVAAGNPAASYLIQKMLGSAATGTVMPPTGALQQSDIDVISQWITDGAVDDTDVPLAPIRVTMLSPMPGANLTAGPAQILAGFDRDLDVSTVNFNTFILQGAGGDNIFGNGNDVQIAATSISVPSTNRSAVFSLAGTTLADDVYRTVLTGTGGSVIMDTDANALDGEFTATFPSGNGVAGGDFQAQFTVASPVVIGPTLDQIQAVVFTPTCATSSCHSGPAGNVLPSGLDLSSADASFASLVGVPSIQDPVILRVAINDPDASYLIHKLEAAGGANVMPPTGMLSPAVIAEIRLWITNGAVR